MKLINYFKYNLKFNRIIIMIFIVTKLMKSMFKKVYIYRKNLGSNILEIIFDYLNFIYKLIHNY